MIFFLVWWIINYLFWRHIHEVTVDNMSLPPIIACRCICFSWRTILYLIMTVIILHFLMFFGWCHFFVKMTLQYYDEINANNVWENMIKTNYFLQLLKSSKILEKCNYTHKNVSHQMFFPNQKNISRMQIKIWNTRGLARDFLFLNLYAHTIRCSLFTYAHRHTYFIINNLT